MKVERKYTKSGHMRNTKSKEIENIDGKIITFLYSYSWLRPDPTSNYVITRLIGKENLTPQTE